MENTTFEVYEAPRIDQLGSFSEETGFDLGNTLESYWDQLDFS
ncbi:lasso RiPP family leader peptide-containing protein [Streptomyces sp. NPDC055189]